MNNNKATIMSTHKELATANTFNEKFKRALLDYYGYGFKSIPSGGTLAEDWSRLNNIIRDYVTWSSNRRETAYASVDSQSMETNPFHRVYRFCGCSKTSDPVYFLHTIAILSKGFTFRKNMVDDDYLNEDSIDEEAYLRILEGKPLKTSDIAFLYTQMLSSDYLTDKNRTPNNKLKALKELGLIETHRRKAGGDHRWVAAPLTMKNVIEAGEKASEGFGLRFKSFVDFYSRYHLFGEIGMYLLDRMGTEYSSPFRVKHDYFTQSLNDFNIIDLLDAIKNKQWCRIAYRHGVTGLKTELLCYPIELRISYANGREYLIYYEPFKRSATALRLEFIDSISVYSDKEIKEDLVSLGYSRSGDIIESDIKNAKDSLRYAWGVAISKIQVGNAVKPVKPHKVSMRIAYDEKKEYYIRNRLFKEHRNGKVSSDQEGYIGFTTEVSDETEMLPWVRSFYSRIVECDGFTGRPLSIKSDVERTLSHMMGEAVSWGIPQTVAERIGGGTKAASHNLLFNEIFSTYYYVLSDVFTALSSAPKARSFTECDITDLIKNSLNKYSDRIGAKTEQLLPGRIKDLILDCGLIVKSKENGRTIYQSRYRCDENTEFYMDIVPLSVVEIRWLKTVLADDKARYFFGNERECIEELLDTAYPAIAPFDMSHVVYFDRYHYPEEAVDIEAKAFAVTLDSIHDGATLRISYKTNLGKIKKGEFKPLIIEFSKRDNRFQGYFQSCRNDGIFAFNLDSIESIEPTDRKFEYSSGIQALAEYRLQRKRSVEIEFYNMHNVVDRILMEFAPWEKRCVFDEKTGLYKLTVYYLADDEIALVIRLMGYGTEIRFTDNEQSIYKEIIRRLKKQKELLREKELQEIGKGTEIDDR